MTEKSMQVLFRGYLEKNPPEETEAYELKICKTNALPFSALKEHQIDALLTVESDRGFFHKITDPPVFAGMNTKFNLKRPFDCFYLSKAKSFIIIWFYKPRQKKVFIKIPIKEFMWIQTKIIRKSLTEELALGIGTKLEIS